MTGHSFSPTALEYLPRPLLERCRGHYCLLLHFSDNLKKKAKQCGGGEGKEDEHYLQMTGWQGPSSPSPAGHGGLGACGPLPGTPSRPGVKMSKGEKFESGPAGLCCWSCCCCCLARPRSPSTPACTSSSSSSRGLFRLLCRFLCHPCCFFKFCSLSRTESRPYRLSVSCIEFSHTVSSLPWAPAWQPHRPHVVRYLRRPPLREALALPYTHKVIYFCRGNCIALEVGAKVPVSGGSVLKKGKRDR